MVLFLKRNYASSAGALALWLGMVASSQGQLTVHYDFTPGSIVPDNNGQLTIVQNLGGLSGLTTITDVDVRLDLTSGDPNNPMYLGDLYSSLTFGNTSEAQRTAVLLNRPGRDNNSVFGSGLTSLNVTLDEAAGTNVFNATGDGTYKADGRLSVDPAAAGVAFSAGSDGLSALDGSTFASNRVTLVVADYSQGGVATLSEWGFSTTGTAAATGTFTPGANASLGDRSSGDTNTIGAILSVTGATGGSMQLDFAGTTTFTNGITGSAGITKTGTGTVTLDGTSNYTGNTNVDQGTLAIEGTSTSSAFIVADGATLTGSGSIGGSVTIQAGGTLSSGDIIESLATGALTLQNLAIFDYEMDNDAAASAAGDLTAVSGNLTITNGAYLTLDELGSGTWDVGDKLTLISYSGTWNGGLFDYGGTLADDSTFFYSGMQWLFNYNDTVAGTNFTGDLTGTSYITMTAIPEPRAALLGGIGVLLLLRRRR